MSPSELLTGLADRVLGTAKQVAGSLIGSDNLKREGQLHHDKAGARTQAAELDAAAEHKQRKAELAERRQTVSTERQRLAAQAAADAKEQQVVSDLAAAQQSAELQATRAEVAVERQTAEHNASLKAQEQLAAAERAHAEQDAAQLAAKAREAERVAQAVDPDTKETNK